MGDWVIVTHDDGRRFSVRVTDPRATGEPGWSVLGAETPAAFVADVPKPKPRRRAPRAKDAAPISEDASADG